MDPIVTLYDREREPRETLPAALAALYDGGLVIPQGTAERPYLIANFVETIDGVVSFGLPGQEGGGAISGENEADHAVMGLLRAVADAVIFGAGSLRVEAGHVHTPAFIHPPLAGAYDELRARLGKDAHPPLSVVVTTSGRVDLAEAMFHQPGLRVVLATTPGGAEHLSHADLPAGTEVAIVGTDTSGAGSGGVSPRVLLELLGRRYGVRMALHEGGSHVFSAFLDAGCVDELFLTVAPQLAGRAADAPRLALVEGRAYRPEDAPWATLLSVKRAGSHLLLRYRLRADGV
jgi:riboflavin biosynthesis pyrimidine reductase